MHLIWGEVSELQGKKVKKAASKKQQYYKNNICSKWAGTV